MTTQAIHEAILLFSRSDGTLGPICASYEAAIAATEALAKEGERP